MKRALGSAVVGATIDGRYRVLEYISGGTCGMVYLARHLMLGRRVALKLVRPHVAGDKATRHFQLEAQATSQVQHENVVDISDFGYDAEHGFYMAMEYLDGVCLDRIIVEEGPFSPRRAMHIARQIANAMCTAHARGVVHRDLSPGNIMILQRYRRPDVVKVFDFGVAWVAGSKGARGTPGLVGSPAYMSPEQIDGGEIGQRSDVYGLGAIMYHTLTGVPPFQGDNVFAQLLAHLDQNPEPLRELRDNIHPDIERVVMRCLEKNPRRRFRSMYTLSEAIESVVRVLDASAAPPQARLHVAARRPKRDSITLMPAYNPDADEDGEHRE